MLFAIVGGEATNAIEWEACAPALVAEAIEVSPARPLAGEPVTLTARLRNDGTAATGVFDVRWEAGEAVMRPHGPLAPGEASRESTLVHTVTLPAGEHVVCFRAPGACAATVVRVAEPAELVIGVSDPLRPLDPATPGPAGAARMLDAFAVHERVPGVRLVLRARPDHAPTPRLDRIVILALAPDDLLAGLRTGALHAARLPYDPALERSLAADGRWTVTRVAAGLDVQSRAVCERDPEGAHAHLWYVRD
jgi:hypothetical protein